MALTQVTSIGLKDGEIVNADLHSAASVALSKLADSGALGSAVTATTQSASDDSTKLATTAFVQAAVTSLIDGAPGSLNTLNELAAAINDDSSYATTLTTALATKLPLAGGTLTGNVLHNDGVKDIYGTNSDLQIYHDSSSGESRVEVRNHNLFFEAINQNEIMFTHDGGYMLRMTPDGEVKLFHNGNEKLNTFVNGVTVTGNLYATNAIFVDDSGDNGTSDFIGVGLGKDLKMYHNSSHSFIQNSTGTLYVKSDTISFNKLDGTNLFWSNGSEMRMYPGGNQEFTLDSNGKVDINNGTGQSHYQITQTNGNTVKFGIVSGSDIELSGSANNSIYFKTNGSERLRVNSDGRLFLGSGLNSNADTYKMSIKESSVENAAIMFLDTDNMKGGICGISKGTNELISGTTNVDFVVGSMYAATHIIASPANNANTVIAATVEHSRIKLWKNTLISNNVVLTGNTNSNIISERLQILPSENDGYDDSHIL